MSLFANPIVKTLLSLLAVGLVGSPTIPTLAPFAVYLQGLGGGILGWLHIDKPGAK